MIDDVTACIVLQNRESRGWMYEYGTWVLYCAYALRVEFYCLSRVGGQDTRDSALGGDQGEENGNIPRLHVCYMGLGTLALVYFCWPLSMYIFIDIAFGGHGNLFEFLNPFRGPCQSSECDNGGVERLYTLGTTSTMTRSTPRVGSSKGRAGW